MKKQGLFSYRWVGRMVHPACLCGWVGEPAESLPLAKARFAAHLRDDCPIGRR